MLVEPGLAQRPVPGVHTKHTITPTLQGQGVSESASLPGHSVFLHGSASDGSACILFRTQTR